MRHQKVNRKFGRVRKVRKALMNSLALSLILKGKIMTTDAKAREIRPFTEKLLTVAKNNTLSAKRSVISKIGNSGAKKVFEIAEKMKDRKGGYTRITKLPQRKSDGSFMSVIEFV